MSEQFCSNCGYPANEIGHNLPQGVSYAAHKKLFPECWNKPWVSSPVQPSVPVAGELPPNVAIKLKAAYDMISALCSPRGTEGHRDWVMRIPAEPDYDPDLVIAGALHALESSALQSQRELQVAREEIERLEWEVSHHTDGDLNDLPKTAEEITDADIAYRLEYGKTCRCIHCYWSGHIIRLRARAERLESENSALREAHNLQVDTINASSPS